ncbi:hypothetical protein SCANM63S_05584 [Streptomyces canarius]
MIFEPKTSARTASTATNGQADAWWPDVVRSAAQTSCTVIRPPLPVPFTVARSTPFRAVRSRAAGVAPMRDVLPDVPPVPASFVLPSLPAAFVLPSRP